MGFIASSSTLSATAYLTELGRQYLFDTPNNPRRVVLPNGETIDKLKITRFSLGDPDVNYDLPDILVSGQVPDLSGENETSVKGAKGRQLTDLISPGDSDLPKENISLVEYKATQSQIRFDIIQASPNAKVANLKAIITQQLMTFVDGDLVSDGVYIVTPTSYGKNLLKSNELIIVLREPTATQTGYRLRIIFPTTGDNYNKMTFQFEKADVAKATVVQTVTTTVTAVPVNTTIASTTIPVRPATAVVSTTLGNIISAASIATQGRG